MQVSGDQRARLVTERRNDEQFLPDTGSWIVRRQAREQEQSGDFYRQAGHPVDNHPSRRDTSPAQPGRLFIAFNGLDVASQNGALETPNKPRKGSRAVPNNVAARMAVTLLLHRGQDPLELRSIDVVACDDVLARADSLLDRFTVERIRS